MLHGPPAGIPPSALHQRSCPPQLPRHLRKFRSEALCWLSKSPSRQAMERLSNPHRTGVFHWDKQDAPTLPIPVGAVCPLLRTGRSWAAQHQLLHRQLRQHPRCPGSRNQRRRPRTTPPTPPQKPHYPSVTVLPRPTPLRHPLRPPRHDHLCLFPQLRALPQTSGMELIPGKDSGRRQSPLWAPRRTTPHRRQSLRHMTLRQSLPMDSHPPRRLKRLRRRMSPRAGQS